MINNNNLIKFLSYEIQYIKKHNKPSTSSKPLSIQSTNNYAPSLRSDPLPTFPFLNPNFSSSTPSSPKKLPKSPPSSGIHG